MRSPTRHGRGGWSSRRRRRFATRFVPLCAALAAVLVTAGAALPNGAPTVARPAALELPDAVPAPTPGSARPALEVSLPESRGTVRWRHSRAVGLPYAGHLTQGVQLPAQGVDYVSWDGVLDRTPNRPWRRYGTDRLVRSVLAVATEWRSANPGAPRLLVGDLSRPKGGPFGSDYGGLGHASHQNGLDVDIYYPRKDRKEIAPSRPSQIDRALAQDLVDRLVRHGALFAFVGPNTGLHGPPSVVKPLQYHDDHVHLRIR